MSREDEVRYERVERIVGATDAAQAKWTRRVTEGMSVSEAIRAAYVEGVTDGLNLFGAVSGQP